jgi:8-oxo-dGTP pyrophosphatase MutT (NUDIX family)
MPADSDAEPRGEEEEAAAAATPKAMAEFTIHPSVSSFNVPYRDYLTLRQTQETRHLAGETPASQEYRHVAVGAFVFRRPTGVEDEAVDRILIVQRAAHDSMPGRWEVPGGACDDDADAADAEGGGDDDETEGGSEVILHAVARELWEETGLVASRVGPLVGDRRGQRFVTRSGKGVVKFNFEVDVGPREDTRSDADSRARPNLPAVKLDPDEHQAYSWVTEEEVVANSAARVETENDGHSSVQLIFTTDQQRETILEAFRARKARLPV